MVCASLRRDGFRKPGTWFYEMIIEKYGEHEAYYIGDAAGRPGDHSSCDKKFADNCNIPFYTPEEIFK